MDSNPKTYFHLRNLREAQEDIAALGKSCCSTCLPPAPDPPQPRACSLISKAALVGNQANTTTSTSASATPTVIQCGGTTSKHVRCSRMTRSSSVDTRAQWFCFQHGAHAQSTNEATSASLPPTVARCGGTTKKGVRCARTKKLGAPGSWFCHDHIRMAPSQSDYDPKGEVTPAPVAPAGPTVVQCGGTTKKGVRCKRKKSGAQGSWFCHDHKNMTLDQAQYSSIEKATSTSPAPTLVQCSSTLKGVRTKKLSDVGQQDSWFGHDHVRMAHDQSEYNPTEKAISAPSTRNVRRTPEPLGYYACNNEWVEFSTWIPDHLQLDTQAKLRGIMQEDPSPSDGPGYLYAFEIEDPKAPEEIQMKVGREGTLNERTKYWSKHYDSCVLRFPPFVLSRDKSSVVPFYKRMERLVHIELADLVQHFAYLDPNFPRAGKAPAYGPKQEKHPCIVPDCVVIHTEIFPFVHFLGGIEVDVDKIVGDVIERWSKFCKTCY